MPVQREIQFKSKKNQSLSRELLWKKAESTKEDL